MKIKGNRVKFEKIPIMVIVRASLSKARHKYFTFLSSEYTYLKEYLEKWIRKGREINFRKPVDSSREKRNCNKALLMIKKIIHFIRQCMRKARVYKRPCLIKQKPG